MIDEIVSIEECEGTRNLIDIEVSGDHLFYANEILTHNSSSDVDLTDTSESFGLPATADFMIALIASEELDELGQIMIKQLKNRYADPSLYKRFVVGIDRSKMKLYDVENSAQDDLMDDSPVFDNSRSGIRLNEESKPVHKFQRNKFKGFQ